MPRPLPIILIVILAPLWACQHSRAPDANLPIQVEGKGKLLAVDQTLGMGTLDIKGRSVMFWWNNQISRPGTGGDPEVKVSQIPFNANVGDTIYFRGLQKNGAIYITAAATQK